MKYLLILFFFCCQQCFCQCKTGDCNNGTGTYDFGWCIYSGQFKNGKPEGKGVMKYDDYTYEGNFKNGVEDGSGVITYKNGRKEQVVYANGTKQQALAKVDTANWKPLQGRDDECITGNCNTGFGTVQFPDGNKYVGWFVNKKRQGKGTFYFANGDRFNGTFNNDLRDEGTYTFNNGYSYTGTFKNDDFYNGVFTAPDGRTVSMKDGDVVEPPSLSLSSGENSSSGNGDCANTISCPHCHGRGYESKPIVQEMSWSVSDTYSVDRYGNRSVSLYGSSGRNRYEIPNYVACSRCGGKGYIRK
jgi:hypothetical protein